MALFVKGNLDASVEERLSEFIVDMNLKYDKVYSVIDINYADYQKWENIIPFYRNVTKEGIILWRQRS